MPRSFWPFIFCFILLAGQVFGLRLAIVSDSKDFGTESLRERLIDEITQVLTNETQLVFSPPHQFCGDGTYANIVSVLNEALEDSDYDMVVTLGAISSHSALQSGPYEKPVFAPFILNAALQKAPSKGEGSGVKNLTYITLEENIQERIALLKTIAPIQHIAFMTNKTLLEAVSEIEKDVRQSCQKEGIACSIVSIDDMRRLDAATIPQGVDALYLAIMPGQPTEDLIRFADALIERKIISYSFASTAFIEAGLLTSLAPNQHINRMMRRVALGIQRALLGQDLDSFSVYLPTFEQLSLNRATAERLELSLPFEILMDAKIIGEIKSHKENALSLFDAICWGVNNNSILNARWHELLATFEVPKLARARLLPQVEIGGDARQIDRNTARLAAGLAPESMVSGFLALRQMIYSNELIGQYLIDIDQRNASIEEFNEEYLQTILEIVTSYLNVLRAKQIESIQKQNLELTLHNLKVAEQRVAVGIARTSEIYRWESQLANNRSTLIIAGFRVKSALTELLRLLNRPQSESLNLMDVSCQESYWVIEPEWFQQRFNSHQKIEKLASFAVCEGFKFSPLIAKYAYIISARSRSVGIAQRAFWTPDLFLTSAIEQRLYKGGIGTAPIIPIDTQWLVGVELRFPLYVGGAKTAELHRTKQELTQARFGFISTTEIIEENIRINLYRAASSHAAIGLSKKALQAAAKNLELISNNYKNGQASILDLLDAQAQTLIAQIEHTEAIFNFLVDLMRLQRSIGRFDILLSNEERNAFREGLNAYIGSIK